MGTPIEGGEVQGGDLGGGDNAPGPNPAWNDVLGVIPQELHEQVTPHFQKWDSAAQSRIESLTQQYSPYKDFVDNGISADDLGQGLQLMYQLNANPQGFYEALQEAYGYGANGQEPEGGNGEGEDPSQNFQDPRFDQLQQGLDLVAQTILQQQEQKLANEADAQIDSELKTLKEKHPGISDEFALSLMVNGFGVDEVGQHWQAVTQNILGQNPRPFAPNVLGSTGGGTGLPSQAIDPTKLSGPDRRSLVAKMVEAMNNQP